jgi:acyl-CoA dehydrogenase family protein 10
MVEREYAVKKVLRANGVAVPEVLALCEDAAVVGTPFYLMKYVPGRIFKDPTLPGVDPADRAAIYDAVAAALAAIHNVDIGQPGLADYGRHDDYFARQIRTWAQQSQASVSPPPGHDGAWGMQQLDNMARLMDWLPANIPPAFPTTVVHGDFRIDNVIFDEREPRVLAILDWELSTLGDPMADLAYSCIPYHLPNTLPQIKGFASPDGRRPEGIPSERDFVERYCRLRGLPLDAVMAHWNFYVAFAFFRITAILQGVYRRAHDGQGASKQALQVGALAGFMSDLAVRAMDRQAALPRPGPGPTQHAQAHTLGRRSYSTFAQGTTGVTMVREE